MLKKVYPFPARMSALLINQYDNKGIIGLFAIIAVQLAQ